MSLPIKRTTVIAEIACGRIIVSLAPCWVNLSPIGHGSSASCTFAEEEGSLQSERKGAYVHTKYDHKRFI
jgi:hypothetical protein